MPIDLEADGLRIETEVVEQCRVRLGRKNGLGFYDYAVDPPAPLPPPD